MSEMILKDWFEKKIHDLGWYWLLYKLASANFDILLS